MINNINVFEYDGFLFQLGDIINLYVMGDNFNGAKITDITNEYFILNDEEKIYYSDIKNIELS